MMVCEKFQIPLDKVFSIVTDGAPSMNRKKNGLVALFRSDERTRDDIISYHCLIHQEHLISLQCLKFPQMSEVMKDVISVVNFIRARPLIHRQFRAMLEEYDVQYGDLVYHTEVRWLSKGEVLKHFYTLLNPIQEFLSQQNNLNAKIVCIMENMKKMNGLKICHFSQILL